MIFFCLAISLGIKDSKKFLLIVKKVAQKRLEF